MRLGVRKSYVIREQALDAWARKGSFDEDLIEPSFNPAIVPFRSIHHFLDPVHGEPLTVGGGLVCTTNLATARDFRLALLPFGNLFNSQRADDWVLGPPTDAFIRNSMNLQAAHDDYWYAVTLLKKEHREEHLVHLFRSLGHIVHLIQDMAQPEHTRNDQHLLAFFDAEPSTYEDFGAQVLTGDYGDTLMRGYPVVRLPRYKHYFTADGTGGAARGAGLADFSNRNFITQDTAYDDQEFSNRCFTYDLPAENLNGIRLDRDVPEVVRDAFGTHVEYVDEYILSSTVDDKYTGTTDTDNFHAFFSSLDLETRHLGLPKYSLSPASFDSRAAMLLPRAVGYSAGIMQHFFRGKLSASWRQVSNAQYELTIRNESSERIGADARLAVSYCPGSQYLDSENDCAWVVDIPFAAWQIAGLNPGESVRLPPLSPPGLRPGDHITQFERRIAVRGTLGAEPDEVIGLIEPPRVSRTAFFNFENLASVATNHISQPAFSFSIGFVYTRVPQNRLVIFQGVNALLNSPVAASGVTLANGLACFSCRSYWNGGWSVITFGSSVENVRFSLGNSALRTPDPQTYRIGYSGRILSPDATIFSTEFNVTLAPGERRTIVLPATGIREIGIKNITQTGEFLVGIDDFTFDFYDE